MFNKRKNNLCYPWETSCDTGTAIENIGYWQRLKNWWLKLLGGFTKCKTKS